MTVTPTINEIRTGRYAVPIYLFLIAAGLAGNHFPFSILNVHFIFGSIFAMLALQIFGWGRGVIAAAVISAYTYAAWNHPWAFVTMTGEVAIVGWLFTRRRVHLVTADALYWLVVGIPVGYFCFRAFGDLPAGNALFLMTKQAINGVANALAARLIFTGLGGRLKTERTSLRETLSNLLVLFVLTSSILVVTHGSRIDLAETDRHICAGLIQDSRNMTDGLENWLLERKQTIVHLASLAAKLPPAQMQARLEQADASDEGFLRTVLINRESIAVAYSPTVDELGRPTIGKSFADRPYLPLLRQSLKPMLSEVMPSRFSASGSVAILLAPVLENGAYNGAVGGILNFDRIRTILQTHAAGRELRYTLLDRNGNVIFSNRKDQEAMTPFSMGKGSFEPLTGLHEKSVPLFTRGKASLTDPDLKIRQWIPALPPGISTIDLWGKSLYVTESTIGTLAEWKLILEQPVAPFQKRLYAGYSEKFYLLFAILFLSLALAAWVSRRTVAAIDGLRVATREMPARIASGEQIAWPESPTFEIHHLIVHVREAADSLREKFVEIGRMNESLEQRVGERTEELHEANRKLQASQTATLSILEDLKAENQARRRKEAELQRVTMAVEQAGEIVFITDPEGAIEYVNPAFEAVTGYTPEETLGQNPRMLKSGKQDEGFYRDLWETIAGGRIWKGRMVNRRKDGKLYTEAATISPVLDETGRIIHYVAVKRDITQQLELTAQFEQAQKMESVGRLAGGVAHDFNNKLTVILGYAQMAMEGLDKTDQQYESLEEVINAGKQSTDIVRQLLAFARKQIIAPEVLDLNETMEGMLKMLRHLIGEDLDLAWEPAANLWQVNMDPTQIDQILANLCVNARDAISGVGKVTIETENVVLDESYCADRAGFVPGEYVMLAVSDDGIGMDKETLAHAFEPFFTTKETGKGTGLGLSTVYGIVKQNQGFVNIYSEPGKGTCFKVYLPRHHGKAEKAVEAAQTETPRGRGETILVVEDEISVLRLAQRVIENMGYTVLASARPAEAVAMAREHAGEIHLLLTDVVLPGMSGKDLAGEMMQIRPNIRVLFMSGYTANVIAHQGVLDEGVHFIGKPFTSDSLARKVREALGTQNGGQHAVRTMERNH